MIAEELKTRDRIRSTSLSGQTSWDESISGSGPEDALPPKRAKPSQTLHTLCRYLDPFHCIRKILRLLWHHFVTSFKEVLLTMKNLLKRGSDNLGWFLSHHPPLVLFTICILAFAVFLMSLASYVSKTHKLNVQDWNMFLDSFSNLEFCIIPNNSSLPVTAPPYVMKRTKQPLPGKHYKTFSVLMQVAVRPTREFVSGSHTVTHLSAVMGGKYIGLKGEEQKQRMNVTFIVPYRWNTSSCSLIPLHSCQMVELNACVQFTGPRDMFPYTSHKPESCRTPSLAGVDYWAKLNWQLPDVDSLYYCRSRTMIELRHDEDPKLFEPIRKPQRSVIQQHLIHTSFFLFLFVILVLVYAAIFDHAKHIKMAQAEGSVSAVDL